MNLEVGEEFELINIQDTDDREHIPNNITVFCKSKEGKLIKLCFISTKEFNECWEIV